MAEVRITSPAQAQFNELPRPIKVRVSMLFTRLSNWPKVSGARPLRGNLAGSYRIRTGDYRVQFRVESGDPRQTPAKPDTVIIEKVGHRDGFYGD